jgi:hypothetical protein
MSRREGGSEVLSPKSGYRFECARQVEDESGVCLPFQCSGSPLPAIVFSTNFSVKEKDEASPFRVCATGFAECLHSPICRG